MRAIIINRFYYYEIHVYDHHIGAPRDSLEIPLWGIPIHSFTVTGFRREDLAGPARILINFGRKARMFPRLT